MGWPVGVGLPKRRALPRYAQPSPSLQLSNPLPNSPGTPTHLGHPHGQLSLSTLVQQQPLRKKSLQKFETYASPPLVISCTNSARPLNLDFCILCIIHGEKQLQVLKLSITLYFTSPNSGLDAKYINMLLVLMQKQKKSTRDEEANQSN